MPAGERSSGFFMEVPKYNNVELKIWIKTYFKRKRS
jgi:hypothetical protein